ncbi:RNA polymerase sigma-70 factor (ECF subfamily) [Chitinophaga niastensis]|uniref:RNA polymerase sigma-70 factor (ECF subfamily) n=1 Tax=Chitinophaga niastensis TaxID=536980 RepID=A0A2P8HC51_CHINA|nr:sigma-70 family RNA polymerase sigma factor [Chitinophaga niastensis]PSL43810.1 RNA polymerase sigma-70 factor (ECF subfamily) [Chitinophaga niastensis]
MSTSDNDTALLAYLKTGSLQAFRHFYFTYRHWLFLTAMTILKDEIESQELVQEFFIDFWQNDRYQKIDLTNIQTLKNFLFVSIKNRCLNQIAKDATRKRRMKDIMLPEEYTLPNNKLENNELKELLEGAINQLPERQSQVFRLAYQEHKTRKEIAASMQISEETVKKQVANALKTLRAYLRKMQF